MLRKIEVFIKIWHFVNVYRHSHKKSLGKWHFCPKYHWQNDILNQNNNFPTNEIV